MLKNELVFYELYLYAVHKLHQSTAQREGNSLGEKHITFRGCFQILLFNWSECVLIHCTLWSCENLRLVETSHGYHTHVCVLCCSWFKRQHLSWWHTNRIVCSHHVTVLIRFYNSTGWSKRCFHFNIAAISYQINPYFCFPGKSQLLLDSFTVFRSFNGSSISRRRGSRL